MDPRGNYERPGFRDLAHPEDETMIATEAHGRARAHYQSSLIALGMTPEDAEKVGAAHFSMPGEHIDALMNVHFVEDALSIKLRNERIQRGPLGIREEVSYVDDLETIACAVEAQAKLLYRRSGRLKAEANRLYDAAVRIRSGGTE